MKVLLLHVIFLTLTPSKCTGNGQSSAQNEQASSGYESADKTGQSGNKCNCDANSNTLIVLEMFKLSREMNSWKEQLETQTKEFELLKADYRRFEDKQASDFDGLNEEMKRHQENQERKIEDLQSVTRAFKEKQEKLESKLDALTGDINQTEEVLQSQETKLEKLHEDTQNNTQKLQDFILKRDSYMQSQFCKARSVALPSNCKSTKCCMKHMANTYPSCLPHCECPNGYQRLESGNVCYKIYLECKNWNDARKVCTMEGGDLIVLSDKKTFNFFQTLARKAKTPKCTYHGYWVGLTDEAKEGEWVWVDGTIAGQGTPWGRSEPSGGIENYAHMWLPYDYKLNDAGGKYTNAFICALEWQTLLAN